MFAQLYSLGKYHGVQPFIVQLRDFDTHKPMKGITIGEIGPKVGFNNVNNGFLGFENVRIPLKNMLMRYSKVHENGEFTKLQNPILTYGVMTYVRVGILRDQAACMSKAVTIAMRYSTVRRQSPIDPNLPEPKIIEHVTQQNKVLPLIAKVIVFKIAADSLIEMYSGVTAEIENGNLERLPEFHALTCCLKSVCTNEGTQCVQTSRLACGGHGYLNSSGFNYIYGHVAAAQAYEGDNTILFLQTARFLIKSWKLALTGEALVPTVRYLSDYANRNLKVKWQASPRGILKALQAATAGKTASAFKKIEQRKKFISIEEANSQTGIELASTAELHCQVFFLESAINTLEISFDKVSTSLALVFKDILELYALDLATRYIGSLLQFVEMSADDVEDMQQKLEAVLKKFRINAIGIVDGFDIPDSLLCSTLGAYDGNVYERLLEAAKSSPLNQEEVNKSFHLYLKPFMKSNL